MAWSTFLGSGNVGSASTFANSFSSFEQSTSTFVFCVFVYVGWLDNANPLRVFLIDLSYKLHSRYDMAHSFCCMSVSVMMCSWPKCTKRKVLFYHKMSGSMRASHGIPKIKSSPSSFVTAKSPQSLYEPSCSWALDSKPHLLMRPSATLTDSSGWYCYIWEIFHSHSPSQHHSLV